MVKNYRNDLRGPKIYKKHFYRSVRKETEKYLLTVNDNEIDAINIILTDIGSNFTIDNSYTEEYVIEAFLRVIKLKLTYRDNVNNVRMKLRTLLVYFGYKRIG